MAISPRIYSKESLKQYIFRKLGSPVVNIELTDDQLDDAIADTLDEFLIRAYSGITETFVPIQLKQGIQQIVLPYDVFAVLSVNSASMGGIGSSAGPLTNPFHINQFIAADLYSGGAGKIDLVSYELTFEMIETLNLLLGNRITFDFNTNSKVLTIHDNIVTDTNSILHIYKLLTPKESLKPNPNYNPLDPTSPQQLMTEETNIYDNKWVKRMALERARYQWAVNLMKYEGSVLPNGGTINSSGIMSLAESAIEKLLVELSTEWELPADFFVG